jgi:uncharacterized membrane protein (DUF2068 family)
MVARKGSRLHRASGILFVYAMLVMSLSGAVLAALKPERVSLIAGMLTFYLVITALFTVRSRKTGRRWAEVAASLLGLAIFLPGAWFGIEGLIQPTAKTSEAPIGIGLAFGLVAFLAWVGDIRFLLAKNISWKQSIARHLWRMCLALWIAAASFFLGQADEIPEALRIMPLLCTPVALVFLSMLYWLARVSFTHWRPQAG